MFKTRLTGIDAANPHVTRNVSIECNWENEYYGLQID
jgi:hypothetical protein